MRRNERVSTDLLVEALWHEDVPPKALQTVRTYISRLRRILRADDAVALTLEPGGYRLSVGADRVDLDRFVGHAAAGRTALLAGDARRAERRLRAALRLFRGSPLAGHEHLDLGRDEAQRIRELRLLVEEDLADAMLVQGRHRDLTHHLRELAAEEPYRERFAAQLMLALYRSGEQVEALNVYRTTRGVLREQLGLEPGRELQQLERRILLQERTLDHDMVGRLHGIPRHGGRFVGRGDDAAAVRRMLRRERLVTVVGPAGAGKTRLAAEVAGRLRRHFPDGVWWIALEPAGRGETVSAIGRGLGIRDSGHGSLSDVVIARLRGERALIVLDNCEHVAAEVSRFAEQILHETDGVRLLATSREPLRSEAEQVQLLRPLEVPDLGAAPSEILESVAVRLLLARASAAGVRRAFGPDDAAHLREVVDRLDGLPLAIELAAGKLGAISAAELAESLDRGLGLLRDGRRSASARHRTIEAAIAWSYDSLSAEQQQTLRLLSVFPASFDGAAARAVAGPADSSPEADVLPILAQLAQKSLLVADIEDATRYRLLGVVRTFARTEAARLDEITAASRRHRAHYALLAEDISAHMLDAGLGAWLRIGSLEHDNLRAAVRWSLAERNGEEALQLASALAPFWFRIGHLGDGRVLLEQALDLAGTASPWRARALLGRAWLAGATGGADAVEAAREAVEAAVPGSEPYAFALAQVADHEIRAGRTDRSRHRLAEAHAIFRRLGQAEGLALVEQLAGLASLRVGNLDQAIEHLTASRERYRELRGNLDAGWTLVLLARAGLEKDDIELSRSAASDAVRDFRMRGDQRGVAASLACLGRAHIVAGDRERARTLLAEAVRLAETYDYAVEAGDARRALDALGSLSPP